MGAFSKSTDTRFYMNTIFGFFVVLIILGINGLFYYAAYHCGMKALDCNESNTWRFFNACYFLMSIGVAGVISVGLFTAVDL